jgi:hypothetical protein
MQRLTLEPFSIVLPLLQLSAVVVGLIGMGWLLAAFHVSWVIWSITFALAVYLGLTETDGIVLSSAWAVSFVSASVVVKAWPEAWGIDIPYKASKFWASVFLLFWAGAIALIVLLATAGPPMKTVLNAIGIQKQSPKSMLIALAWISLGTGWVLYDRGIWN